MSELIGYISNLAQGAGKILRDSFSEKRTIHFKGEVDLVTDVDRRSEDYIKARLLKDFPKYGILAEEGGRVESESEYCWLIDPLDGTTNYAHSYPFFCVSIALEYRRQIELGVIYDPLKDELFQAAKDGGALMNGVKISVSKTSNLEQALIATGFPYDRKKSIENNLDFFKAFLFSAQGVRRDGSAALDLCYVASGRLDGFWELKLAPWDTPAGALMVTEAGGRVSNFKGGGFDNYQDEALASNGLIHDEMIDICSRIGRPAK